MPRRRSKGLAAPLAALVACAALGASAGTGPCEEGIERDARPLGEGLVLHEESCLSPLYHAYIVEMDLDAPGYRFLVTPWKDRLGTTSEFAALHGALVATNGGFWGSSWGGLTVSDGSPWPGKPADDEVTTVVGFGSRNGDGRIRVGIRPAAETLVVPHKWMRQALLANATLLEKGNVVEHDVDDPVFTNRNPRTAVGLTKDRATLFIVVVDGRQEGWSRGLKLAQLSRLLASHGAWSAANLDGGASSTLVVPQLGGLVNSPCTKTGEERQVPNHLGILGAVEDASTGLARLLLPLAGLLRGWPSQSRTWSGT